MEKKLNIVIGASIEGLKKGFNDAVKVAQSKGGDISKAVESQANQIRASFEKIARSTNTASSVRQLQNLAMAMQKLGPEFKDVADSMIKEAGEIKDSIGDMRAQINYFASDTRRFDAVISGVKGLAGAFAVAEGTMAVFGIENEDLQKTMVKLTATMSILSGLTELQNVLQKESAARTGFAALQTQYLAVANYAAASSMNAFKVALATTGIGVAIVAVGMLTMHLMELQEAEKKAADQRKQNRDEMEKATSQLDSQVRNIRFYQEIVNDTTKSEKERTQALRELNQLGVATEGINFKNAASLQKLNQMIEDNIIAMQNKAIAEGYSGQVSRASIELINQKEAALKRENFAIAQLNVAQKAGYETFQQQYNLDKVRLENKKKVTAAEEALTAVLKKQQEALGAYNKAMGQAIPAEKKKTEKKERRPKGDSEFVKEMKAQEAYLDNIQKKILKGSKTVLSPKADITPIKFYTEQYDKYSNQRMQTMLKELKLEGQWSDNMKKALDQVNQAATNLATGSLALLGETIGDALSGGTDSMQKAFNSMGMIIADFLESTGKALIAAAILRQAFVDLLVANPVAAIAVGVGAVAAAVVLRNKIEEGPKFAKGGIAFGEVNNATLGEYANARYNPEVVAPLRDLKGLLGLDKNNNMNTTPVTSQLVGTVKFDGRDLLLAVKQAERDNKRG